MSLWWILLVVWFRFFYIHLTWRVVLVVWKTLIRHFPFPIILIFGATLASNFFILTILTQVWIHYVAIFSIRHEMICLMDTCLYMSKIEEHPADSSSYKDLSSDPTQAVRNDVLSTLNYLYHTHRIEDVTRYHRTPSKPPRTPLIYGLPKVHSPSYHLDQ